jgi:hypothetical protein
MEKKLNQAAERLEKVNDLNQVLVLELDEERRKYEVLQRKNEEYKKENGELKEKLNTAYKLIVEKKKKAGALRE